MVSWQLPLHFLWIHELIFGTVYIYNFDFDFRWEKELIGVIKLKKYRAMRKAYNDGRGIDADRDADFNELSARSGDAHNFRWYVVEIGFLVPQSTICVYFFVFISVLSVHYILFLLLIDLYYG